MNLPNRLTILRIIFIPIFVILLIRGYKILALVTFGLASLTDALDGAIARARDQESKLGSFLDPVADKLLINTSFITLAVMKNIPKWLAIIVISRDIVIVLGVMTIYVMNYRINISPRLIGKSTATVQMLTILIVLINLWSGVLPIVVCFFVWISAILTIISGFDYILVASGMYGSQT